MLVRLTVGKRRWLPGTLRLGNPIQYRRPTRVRLIDPKTASTDGISLQYSLERVEDTSRCIVSQTHQPQSAADQSRESLICTHHRPLNGRGTEPGTWWFKKSSGTPISRMPIQPRKWKRLRCAQEVEKTCFRGNHTCRAETDRQTYRQRVREETDGRNQVRQRQVLTKRK